MASLLVPVGSLARGSKVDGGLYSLFGALCPYGLCVAPEEGNPKE